jgi:hypothetical protein
MTFGATWIHISFVEIHSVVYSYRIHSNCKVIQVDIESLQFSEKTGYMIDEMARHTVGN